MSESSGDAASQCRTSECFIKGTQVLTKEGYKAIEDIQVGDLVLAYNEETGEAAYKPVLRLFRNESAEWTGITIDGTEIISTPGLKYYLPETKGMDFCGEIESRHKGLAFRQILWYN